MIAVVVAVIDIVQGEPVATQWFAAVLPPLAAVVAAGHLLAVLNSSRLR